MDVSDAHSSRSPYGLELFRGESERRQWPRNWWVHLLLFSLTVVTTTVFGFAVVQSFMAGRGLDLDWLLDGYIRVSRMDPIVWSGLYFSGPLLLMLLAHEFGHYLTCLRWRVKASLPYFLPSPLLLGTFGAFIRIRSPIYTRKSLFDIGVSGPLAGFAVVVPCLFIGTGLSRVVRGIGVRSALSFGTPIIMRLAERIWFGSIPARDIALHPLAMAAWAGLLATAMNLLPIGQLDGGHILYAALGERWHHTVSLVFIGVLVLLGFVYHPWWAWAALMFLFGRRHPLVYDETPLPRRRMIIAAVAFVLLVLSLSVVPVSIK